jgi:hypothetical protein
MDSVNNTIFVSAYITNINNYRNVSKYIEYGKKMLNINIFQIIFIEKYIFDDFFSMYNNEKKGYFTYVIENISKTFEYIVYENKIFVFFNKEDIYLYNYKINITEFNVESNNPSKDTIDYMFIQCHKCEWVKMAIFLMKQKKENLENINFLWIDYGIYHMINNEEVFKKELKELENRNTLKLYENKSVRIGSCWDLSWDYDYVANNNVKIDIYNNVTWYFAGSIFGGNESILIEFADKMKNKSIQIIKEKKSLMWEVNVWYLIYLENRQMFDTYFCGHDISIIANY